ncbi:MAG TPA: hypothetical protein VKS43_07945 [Burkholderiales bacterium]|nr:hypothetical protein [Burkholderiales bacterium]
MIRRPLPALVLALALALTAATALVPSFPAEAQLQVRTIPPEAKRGVMSHVQAMTVQLNGKQVSLAPGAQIRDAGNLLIVPTAIPPGILVKYLVDRLGLVTRVWILTPQEAAQPDPKT